LDVVPVVVLPEAMQRPGGFVAERRDSAVRPVVDDQDSALGVVERRRYSSVAVDARSFITRCPSEVMSKPL